MSNADNINYGFIVVDRNRNKDEPMKVYHFVGYQYPPSLEDMIDFDREIKEDPEFRLDIDYQILVAPEDWIQEIKTDIINQ